VPEIDVDVARAQFAVSVPLMVNDISKKDGAGAFEKALLAKTWKWTAEAQNIPLDKLEHVPPKLNRWGSMGFTGRSG